MKQRFERCPPALLEHQGILTVRVVRSLDGLFKLERYAQTVLLSLVLKFRKQSLSGHALLAGQEHTDQIYDIRMVPRCSSWPKNLP